METLRQAKRYWIKWIDRQYAKADPSHAKVRTEFLDDEEMDSVDAPVTATPRQERTNGLLPPNSFKRR
jgi:hypothetical protein